MFHDVSKDFALVLLYYKENLYSCHEDDKHVVLIVSVIIGFHAVFDPKPVKPLSLTGDRLMMKLLSPSDVAHFA